MYLKRHFITTLNPIEIKEKLNKNINSQIGIHNYFSFHKKENWFGSVSENGFILTQTPKWYRKNSPIQIKGIIEPLPYNGGSKIILTMTVKINVFIGVLLLLGFIVFSYNNLPDAVWFFCSMLGILCVIILVNAYWLSEQLKSELNAC
ncbi:MAG: hypothetical protein Q4B79_01150 [Moraxella sp.]|uniref:hypothetical protein n=1 Tax=Moraxella sp. TaxID=479 RepID=UPI0026DBBB56|nr:hypothetical protein [Moraxella sp.]MDO4449552.1 hypothetical protein [Moraxella sp.]